MLRESIETKWVNNYVSSETLVIVEYGTRLLNQILVLDECFFL
jgi:hypothetical protein